jgi:hypothetical protein
MKCNNCKYNNGVTDAGVACGIENAVVQMRTICAAQVLTIAGWVGAVNEAEAKGDFERGKVYRDRIIQLKREKAHA